MDKKQKRFYNRTEAAEFLEVHPNTLLNWDRKGLLKPLRFGYRKTRKYKITDLEIIMKKGLCVKLH